MALSSFINLGRTRNMNINLVLGIPDEDDEWQYNIESDGEGRVYHFRIDDEIWYYTYDSTTFELAEEPNKIYSTIMDDKIKELLLYFGIFGCLMFVLLRPDPNEVPKVKPPSMLEFDEHPIVVLDSIR